MVTRKFGLVAAAAQVLAIVRSVAVPPKRRAPCGSRALKLNSNAFYDCLTFESLVSTFCTAPATAVETVSYIVIARPSIGLKMVTGL